MRKPIGTFRNGRMRFALCAILGAILLATFPAGVSFAKSALEIDTSVDVCLERFYKQVKGAKEFARTAKGLLVMPNVVKGGVFVGGPHGERGARGGGRAKGHLNPPAA